MSEHEKEKDPAPMDPPAQEGGKEPSKEPGKGGSATATAKPKKKAKPVPKSKPPGMLPPWKVLLHNDDKNDVLHVVDTIVELTPLNKKDAELRTVEAHKTGVALILVTHKERAELYKEQFESKSLIVTIEPAE